MVVITALAAQLSGWLLGGLPASTESDRSQCTNDRDAIGVH
jgi:hypothetical protein